MSVIELNDYEKFVKSTVSKPSLFYSSLISRLNELDTDSAKFGVGISQLLTASAGLSAESGEFTEVVKKIIFQGKELNEDNIFHMKRELGDICWYLAVACSALNTSLEEVLVMNVEKLSARYPAGFEIIKSEIRAEGDL
ncbi:pyrophosphatase [Candidatus Woesearchaeota archaeon]|nr:pyrophosphatase [Candidatus Woesearchaeota archaeon]